MATRPNDGDNDATEVVSLDLPLDRGTIAWLATMGRDDVEVAEVVASMLRMIRIDDEAAHRCLH